MSFLRDKRYIVWKIALFFVVFGLSASFVSAQQSGLQDIRALIEQLQKQILAIQNQLGITQSVVSPVPVSGSPLQSTASPSQGYIISEEVPGNPQIPCVLPELRWGSQNSSVYLLQLVLKQANHYPEGLITGFYGRLTQTAVERFQAAQNISASGQVDIATAADLNILIKRYFPAECGSSDPLNKSPVITNAGTRDTSDALPSIVSTPPEISVPYVEVRATVDGKNFDDGVGFRLTRNSDGAVFTPRAPMLPVGFENMTPGVYTLAYTGSGPGTFSRISWINNAGDNGATSGSTQTTNARLLAGGVLTFTIEFTRTGFQSLTVLLPNGGETLIRGQDYLIRWNASNYSGIVSLHLVDLRSRDTEALTIASGLSASSGSYPWIVPSVFSGDSAYVVEIRGKSISDRSNSPFSIFPFQPSIVVLSPNKGETWVEGNSYSISWKSLTGDFDYYVVTIHNMEMGGIDGFGAHPGVDPLHTFIPKGISSMKMFVSKGFANSFVVNSDGKSMAQLKGKYLVRVLAVKTKQIGSFDLRDVVGMGQSGLFDIISPGSAQPFTVTFPTAGTALIRGQSYAITWSGGDPNIMGYSVYLVGGGLGTTGGVPLGLASTNAGGGGTFNWTIPPDFKYAGSGFQIKFFGGYNAGGNSPSFSIVSLSVSDPCPSGQVRNRFNNQCLTPASGQVTSFTANKTAYAVGEIATFEIGAVNSGSATWSGLGPNSGTTYGQNQDFNSLGFPDSTNIGRTRVTVGSGYPNYPWRWNTGNIAPGGSITVTGNVKWEAAGTYTLCAGLVQEYQEWIDREKFCKTVVVSPSSQTTVSVDLKVNDSDNPVVQYNSQIAASWTSIGASKCIAADSMNIPKVEGGLWTDQGQLPLSGRQNLYARWEGVAYYSPLRIGISCWNDVLGGMSASDTVLVTTTQQPPIQSVGTVNVITRVGGQAISADKNNNCTSNLSGPSGSNTAGCVRTLTNQPTGAYSVQWYSGYPTGADTTKTPTITSNQTLFGGSSVTFYLDFQAVPVQHTLIVSKSGTGTITSKPAGINCGSTCSAKYDPNATVLLTPSAETGVTWQGCDAIQIESGNDCAITMTGNRTVNVNFVEDRGALAPASVLSASFIEVAQQGLDNIAAKLREVLNQLR